MGGCQSQSHADGAIVVSSTSTGTNINSNLTLVKEKARCEEEKENDQLQDAAPQTTSELDEQTGKSDDAPADISTSSPSIVAPSESAPTESTLDSAETSPGIAGTSSNVGSAVLPDTVVNATAAIVATSAADEFDMLAAVHNSSSTNAAAAETSASVESPQKSDEEFKNTVKTVLLLLLDRLTRTMEYEKLVFGELASKCGLHNYMELFDYQSFERLLRDNFSIPASPLPMGNDADGRAISQHFTLFLSLAQNGTVLENTHNNGRPYPTRIAFTERLQAVCEETRTRLLTWCRSPHASDEVKEHFTFFANALEFSNGDLVGNPQLLNSNIDSICAK